MNGPSTIAAQCSSPTGAALGSPGTVVPGSVVGFPVLASSFLGNNPSTANPHNYIETSIQHNTQNDDIALAGTATYHFPGMDLEYLGGYQSFFYHLNFGTGVDAGIKSYQIAGPPCPAGSPGMHHGRRDHLPVWRAHAVRRTR